MPFTPFVCTLHITYYILQGILHNSYIGIYMHIYMPVSVYIKLPVVYMGLVLSGFEGGLSITRGILGGETLKTRLFWSLSGSFRCQRRFEFVWTASLNMANFPDFLRICCHILFINWFQICMSHIFRDIPVYYIYLQLS